MQSGHGVHPRSVEDLINQAIEQKDTKLLKEACHLYKKATSSNRRSISMDPFIVKCHIIYLAIKLNLDIQNELKKWEKHKENEKSSSSERFNVTLNFYLLYLTESLYNKDPKKSEAYRALKEALSLFGNYNNDENFQNQLRNFVSLHYYNEDIQNILNKITKENKELNDNEIEYVKNYISDYLWVIDEIPKEKNKIYEELLDRKYCLYYALNPKSKNNSESCDIYLEVSEFDAINTFQFYRKGVSGLGYCGKKWKIEDDLPAADVLKSRQSKCITALNDLKNSLMSSSKSSEDSLMALIEGITIYISYEFLLRNRNNSNIALKVYKCYREELKKQENKINSLDSTINYSFNFIFSNTNLDNIEEAKNIISKLLTFKTRDKAIKDKITKIKECVENYSEFYSDFLKIENEYETLKKDHISLDNKSVTEYKKIALEINNFLKKLRNDSKMELYKNFLETCALYADAKVKINLAFLTRNKQDLESAKKDLQEISSLENIKKSFVKNSTEPDIYKHLSDYLLETIRILMRRKLENPIPDYDNTKSLSENFLDNFKKIQDEFYKHSGKKIDFFLVSELMLELLHDTGLKESHKDLYNILIKNHLDNIKNLIEENDKLNDEDKFNLYKFYIEDHLDEAIARFPNENKFIEIKLSLLKDYVCSDKLTVPNEDFPLPEKIIKTDIDINNKSNTYKRAYKTLEENLDKAYEKLGNKQKDLLLRQAKYNKKIAKLNELSEEIKKLYESVKKIDIKQITSDDIQNIQKFIKTNKAIEELKQTFQSTTESFQKSQMEFDKAKSEYKAADEEFKEFIIKKNKQEEDAAKEKAEKERKQAEAKAERERKQAETKAERERKQAEAKAEKERKQAEAKAERERKQAEAKAEKERIKAENKRKQAEVKVEKERKQAEAKARAEKVATTKAKTEAIANIKNEAVAKAKEEATAKAKEKAAAIVVEEAKTKAKVEAEAFDKAKAELDKTRKEEEKAMKALAEAREEEEAKKETAKQAQQEVNKSREKVEQIKNEIATIEQIKNEIAARAREKEEKTKKELEVKKEAEAKAREIAELARKEAETKVKAASDAKIEEAKAREEADKARKEEAEIRIEEEDILLLNGEGSKITYKDLDLIYKLQKDLNSKEVGSWAALLCFFYYNPKYKKIAKKFSFKDIDLVVRYFKGLDIAIIRDILSKMDGKIQTYRFIKDLIENEHFLNAKEATDEKNGVDKDLTVEKSPLNSTLKFMPFHFIHLEIIEKDQIKDNDKIILIGNYYFKLCIDEGFEEIVENACKFTEFLVKPPENNFKHYGYILFKYLEKLSNCESELNALYGVHFSGDLLSRRVSTNNNLFTIDELQKQGHLVNYYANKLQSKEDELKSKEDEKVCYDEMKRFAIGGIPEEKENLARPFIQAFYFALLQKIFEKNKEQNRGDSPPFEKLASVCTDLFIEELVRGKHDNSFNWIENINAIALNQLAYQRFDDQLCLQYKQFQVKLHSQFQKFQDQLPLEYQMFQESTSQYQKFQDQLCLDYKQSQDQTRLQYQQLLKDLRFQQAAVNQEQVYQEYLIQQQQIYQNYLIIRQQKYLQFLIQQQQAYLIDKLEENNKNQIYFSRSIQTIIAQYANMENQQNAHTSIQLLQNDLNGLRSEEKKLLNLLNLFQQEYQQSEFDLKQPYQQYLNKQSKLNIQENELLKKKLQENRNNQDSLIKSLHAIRDQYENTENEQEKKDAEIKRKTMKITLDRLKSEEKYLLVLHEYLKTQNKLLRSQQKQESQHQPESKVNLSQSSQNPVHSPQQPQGQSRLNQPLPQQLLEQQVMRYSPQQPQSQSRLNQPLPQQLLFQHQGQQSQSQSGLNQPLPQQLQFQPQAMQGRVYSPQQQQSQGYPQQVPQQLLFQQQAMQGRVYSPQQPQSHGYQQQVPQQVLFQQSMQGRVYSPQQPQSHGYQQQAPQQLLFQQQATQSSVYSPQQSQSSVYGPVYSSQQSQSSVYGPVYSPQQPQMRIYSFNQPQLQSQGYQQQWSQRLQPQQHATQGPVYLPQQPQGPVYSPQQPQEYQRQPLPQLLFQPQETRSPVDAPQQPQVYQHPQLLFQQHPTQRPVSSPQQPQVGRGNNTRGKS